MMPRAGSLSGRGRVAPGAPPSGGGKGAWAGAALPPASPAVSVSFLASVFTINPHGSRRPESADVSCS